MNYLKRTVVLSTTIVAVLVAALLGAPLAWAQAESDGTLNLTLSPIYLSLETKPGETAQTAIKVLNNGSQTENLKLELVKFSANAANSKPVIEPFAPTDEFKNWLTFSEDTMSVAPQEWKTVQVTFSPPESAALSYYYAILVRRQVDAAVADGQTVISAAPAILVLATVPSPLAKQELQLIGFRAKRKIFEFLPAEFEVEVKNTGNIHLAPIGNIFVDQANGTDVGMLQLNSASGLILPGATRIYNLKWNDGFPAYQEKTKDGQVVTDEQGQPDLDLTWDLSKISQFRFGQFSAHLLFIFDNGERDVPIEAKLTFWVIPWRILAAGAVVVTFTLVGLWVMLRQVWKKVVKKSS